ncbi:MAG: hypothetical protein QNJ35_15410 [Paracoccaceae bacterium]|nr:hypothetical protein [Paracoccaceae bacterium]
MHLKSSTSRAAFTAVLSLIAAPAVAETQHVVTAVSGDGSIYAAMAAANSGTGA